MDRKNVVALFAVESDDASKLMEFMITHNIAYCKIEGFFTIEGFTTVKEVETWWLGK